MKWISIKDKLPEDGAFCLVYCPRSFPKNYRGVVGKFYDDNNMFYSESSDEPIEDATHWIELPEEPTNIKKFRISIIDFMRENGKHEAGVDKEGTKLFLGDMVEYNGEQNWFVAYRYGQVMLKQVGQMAMIVLNDSTNATKVNVFGAGTDWLIIAETHDPIYDKVKHLVDETV